MIKLVRVDHRLIHGQVAFSWTKFLDADCILCACDALMKDDLRMDAMRMAVPNGVKLVMKTIDDSITAINSGVTDKYKLFVLCESVEEVHRLTTGVSCIREVNLGGTKNAPDRRAVAKAVHLSGHDVELVKDMLGHGVRVFTQLVPDDQETDAAKLI